MQNFNYSYPVKVIFGNDAVKNNLSSLLKAEWKNIMLAYGGGSIKKNGIYDELCTFLKNNSKNIIEFSGIMSNPTYAKVQEGTKVARDNKVDFILAVGGGSVIDCCKVISAQAKLDEDLWNFEYEKHCTPADFIPMGAVVTAFGTGAEMNNGAVITNTEKKMKSPLWGAFYNFAILDPVFTMSMPLKQVVSGSFDSLSHCMETYMGSPRESCLSDELNEAVMRCIIKNLRLTLKDPGNVNARSELLWAAAMAENGILKLGKTTDFQCHMLEHQLGAYTDCNHGQGLAVIHPVLYSHMLNEGKQQFARLATNVFGIDPNGKDEITLAKEFTSALKALISECSLPSSLKEMGISEHTDLKAIADSTLKTPGCAKKFKNEELLEILKECF